MLDDPRSKSIDPSSTNPSVGAISPYLRSTSHVLTTPPNPLASDDHPDHQNFAQSFTPIPSAGFELSAGRDSKTNTYFTFDESTMKQQSYAEENRSIQRNNLIQDDNSNHSSSNSSTRGPSSIHGKHSCTYPDCNKV